MKLPKNKKILSLLLAVVLIVSAFPFSASAAETNEDHCEDGCCHCEACENADGIEPFNKDGLIWHVDEDGVLTITITETVPVYSSEEDQPWKVYRDEIRYAYVQNESEAPVESMAYWFADCVELRYAELPANIAEIGFHAFYHCPQLREVTLLHDKAPTLTQGAFITMNPLIWQENDDPRLHFTVYSEDVLDAICAYDWGADECPITVRKVSKPKPGLLKAALAAEAEPDLSGYCRHCRTTCAYTVEYEDFSDRSHRIHHWCSNCGEDQCRDDNTESHSYNELGYCVYCNHYNSAHDETICRHRSTTKTWEGCNWYEYCDNCGELVDSGITHKSKHRTWEGCNWYEYCDNCGEMTDHGTSHTYTYGEWEYADITQHRRLGTCTVCGNKQYFYVIHIPIFRIQQYNNKLHQSGMFCYTCNEYVGIAVKTEHDFEHGKWIKVDDTQHKRLKNCDYCGYSEYEYGSHVLKEGTWTEISETQHQRKLSCSCGYSITETENHADNNSDGYCDNCGKQMNLFSVTLPVSLPLAMAPDGTIVSALTADIVNQSSAAVKVSKITVAAENGWSLVPFNYDMANVKVDSKLIGFSINGAETVNSGDSEVLEIEGEWTVENSSALPIIYDAVVSPLSTAVTDEQVLSVVFIVDWA